jgi:peptidyl-prolyl cis-trans isomerase A (cyclophilin A)
MEAHMQKSTAIFFALTLLLNITGCFKKNIEASAESVAAPNKVEVAHSTAKKPPSGEDMILKEFDLKPGDKLLATFKTSMGDMTAELYWEKTPITVANFVGLAKGTKEWSMPRSSEKLHKPLYSGTIFHRVIPGFMIQGGDPLGTGYGDPGYRFADEFHPSLRHDSAGILSMANSGPGTNGSQFFITESPQHGLDMRHAVFGKVIENVELVGKIARVPRNANDKPLTDVTLQEIVIRKQPAA